MGVKKLLTYRVSLKARPCKKNMATGTTCLSSTKTVCGPRSPDAETSKRTGTLKKKNPCK
jgi:hypothetical protein